MPTFKPGDMVTLKAPLDDDRYHVERKLRGGQIGVVQDRHGADPADRWWFVQWYPIDIEAPQAVRENEIDPFEPLKPFKPA